MTGAYIRGMGLSCALGEDMESCLSGMQRMQPSSTTVRFADLNEPFQLPYYRIPDSAELFDDGRYARLLPPVLRAAVENAGMSAADIRRLPIFIGSSCFSIGLSESIYAAALTHKPESALPMPLCGYQDFAVIAQQALGSVGDVYMYNTACTASANAMLGALRMIELGWYRHALVIGVELANRTTLTGFGGLQIVAEAVKPFDAERNGMVFGEGIGAVLLSVEADASACLRLIGGANNCDTYSVTTANPNGDAIAAVLNKTLTQINTPPETIQGIKAHGTATVMGDLAEANGIHQSFSMLPPISALKPHMGHTLGACGVNELVLFGAALQRGVLPASPDFGNPDPDLNVHPLNTPGIATDGIYLLNHFGFGGNNTVLALEKMAS